MHQYIEVHTVVSVLTHVQKSLECCCLRTFPPSRENQQMRWLQDVIVRGTSVCMRTMLRHYQGLQLLKDLWCEREYQASNRR